MSNWVRIDRIYYDLLQGLAMGWYSSVSVGTSQEMYIFTAQPSLSKLFDSFRTTAHVGVGVHMDDGSKV